MSSNRQSSGDGFLIPFGLVFLLAGLGVGIFYFSLLGEWYAARSWVEVPCFIESSTLRDHLEVRPSGGTARDTLMNEAMATYRYEFEGRSYTGTDVSFSFGADNFGDFQERVSEVLREYQNSGKPFRCFVNPEAPSEAVIFREARWTLLLFISLFPLLFPLVGGFVSAGGLIQRHRRKKIHAARSRYPDSPWRWRPEWQEDWIRPAQKMAWWPWAVTAGWMSLIWLPMIYALLVEGDVSFSNPVSLVSMLPLLFWAMVMRGLVRRLWAQRQGGLRLHVIPQPINPGCIVQVNVAIPQRYQLGATGLMQVEVCCMKEVTSSSNNRHTMSQEKVWSEHVQVPLSDTVREDRGSRLPFSLTIPAELPAPSLQTDTAPSGVRVEHLWMLELRAAGLGAPVVFDLPVFETKKSDSMPRTEPRVDVARMLNLDADELTLHLAKHHITAVFDSQDLPVSFDLSPKRFASVRLFLTGFTILWSGVFLVMLNLDIPFLFPFIWGVSSVGLWWAILHQMRRRQAIFSDSSLEIRWTLGPWGARSVYEKRHLVQFLHNFNMSSGATTYYVIQVETIFGKKVTLLDGIPDRLVVENLCPLLERWRKQA